MASLIPPKKPKKPGLMPKLAIPAREYSLAARSQVEARAAPLRGAQ